MLRTQSDHCHSVTPEEIQIAARTGHTFSCDSTDVPTGVIKEGYGEEYLTWNAPVASMMKAGVNTVISEFGIQGSLRDSPFEDGVEWLTRKINGETWGVPEEAVSGQDDIDVDDDPPRCLSPVEGKCPGFLSRKASLRTSSF